MAGAALFATATVVGPYTSVVLDEIRLPMTGTWLLPLRTIRVRR